MSDELQGDLQLGDGLEVGLVELTVESAYVHQI